MSIDGIPRQDWGPGGEVRNAPTEPTASAPAPAPESKAVATTEPGAIQRADWTGEEAQPQGGEDVQLPSSDPGVAIGLGPDLVARWNREGGFEHNLRAAQATATKVLSLADDPDGLTASFDKLPSELQSKIFDNLRLSAPYGQNGATLRLEAIVSQCTGSEIQALQSWWNGLTERQQDAIFAGLSK
jgi:hypothetical protein